MYTENVVRNGIRYKIPGVMVYQVVWNMATTAAAANSFITGYIIYKPGIINT